MKIAHTKQNQRVISSPATCICEETVSTLSLTATCPFPHPLINFHRCVTFFLIFFNSHPNFIFSFLFLLPFIYFFYSVFFSHSFSLSSLTFSLIRFRELDRHRQHPLPEETTAIPSLRLATTTSFSSSSRFPILTLPPHIFLPFRVTILGFLLPLW